MVKKIITGQKSEEVINYLLHRRSLSVKHMVEPGPSRDDIQTILTAAARVPDHGKMFPWYFMIFEGDARKQAGELIAKAYKEENPDTPPAKLELEAERFLRAPLVIAVISRMREGKNPLWEQILSAGAACQNLVIAANALGFAANWITEWYSFNDTFRKEIGLDKNDHIAGFIYIGTPKEQPDERPRPDLNEIVTYWESDKPVNKGKDYGYPGKGFPATGFDFSGLNDD